MAMKRMSRDEFFGKLAALDDDGVRKALWNLYWRGSAPMRDRIEREIDPAERERHKRAKVERADPELTSALDSLSAAEKATVLDQLLAAQPELRGRVAAQGDQPVEYDDPDDPQDPAPFDADTINTRLRRLTPAAR